ncbi:DNA cytosine methyltransferase [Actinopolymorpha cephalotaxi]|uniref:Cytosine-specific methyltransferase n=2 Tax=Actinopolymorpha cephalotaxi TaxID=504797 RepID=A0ABX2S8S3_9ACTN|nr:DNA cytosine methyltransferase [Actinopolymorpha cephalotaxi]NYH86043.1 DNA (cytosine-5)-methyltransferase 1 [Actinopolymorpha cephalotaxi]
MDASMIDLFAGCGGMTEGFRQAGGYKPVMAVEWDPYAASTYAANFGEDHIRCADIAEVDAPGIDVDVIIGGPPCQGFSNLGSKDVDDPRNKLWKQYLRFVTETRPKVFVIENVERFRRSAEFELLKQEEHGGLLDEYKLTSGLLLAADYGVPQRRPRTIIIGSRLGKAIPLPPATHSENGRVPGTEPWRTVADAITGLPSKPAHTTLPTSTVRFFERDVPGIFKAADLHIGRQPTQRSLERYDCIPPGGGRFDLPDHLLSNCWRNKRTGTTDVMGRMRWDRPSLTIRTEFFKPEKGQYLHPQWDPNDPQNRVNRVITHLEAARLQDFPVSFVWCGSKIEIAKQIGNAVPPGLAKAIATHLRQYIEA